MFQLGETLFLGLLRHKFTDAVGEYKATFRQHRNHESSAKICGFQTIKISLLQRQEENILRCSARNVAIKAVN